jgi:hypothetical protein
MRGNLLRVYTAGGALTAARAAARRPAGVDDTLSGPTQTPETQKSWRRPIFPKGCPLSIFGAGELDFRVRDGNGYGLSASVTRISCVWFAFRQRLTARWRGAE